MSKTSTYLVSPVSGDSCTTVVLYLTTRRAVWLLRLRKLIDETVTNLVAMLGHDVVHPVSLVNHDVSDTGINIQTPDGWCERFVTVDRDDEPESDKWYPLPSIDLPKWVKSDPDRFATTRFYVVKTGIAIEVFAGDDNFYTKEITWDELLQFVVDHGD